MSAPDKYQALRTKRDLAAYELVGTASALLHFSDLSGEPFDRETLREVLRRYEAADKALGEFTKAAAINVAVKP